MRCSRARLRLRSVLRRWTVGDTRHLELSRRKCSRSQGARRRCGRLGRSVVAGTGEGIVGVALALVVAVHVQKRIEDHDMDMGIGRDMVAASKVMCNRGWHVDLHISGS